MKRPAFVRLRFNYSISRDEFLALLYDLALKSFPGSLKAQEGKLVFKFGKGGAICNISYTFSGTVVEVEYHTVKLHEVIRNVREFIELMRNYGCLKLTHVTLTYCTSGEEDETE